MNIEGILPAHGPILYFLFGRNGPVAMKEIVERVGRVKSTVTGMINTLEQHGYVEKFRSPEDGRVMLVQLTEKGKSIRPEVDKVSATVIEKTYGTMPEKERTQLVVLLAKLEKNLTDA